MESVSELEYEVLDLMQTLWIRVGNKQIDQDILIKIMFMMELEVAF